MPRETLSAAMGLSPWTTWMVTAVWKSAAVVKTLLRLVGIVAFFSISFSSMPPSVSTPSESGVTSSSRMSLISPASTAPCIAAPMATHSIGSTPLSAGFPTTSSTNFLTIGILVIPPMSMTLSTCVWESFASFNTLLIVSSVFVTIGLATSSSLDRVSV